MTRELRRNLSVPVTLDVWRLIDRGASRRGCTKVELVLPALSPLLEQLRAEELSLEPNLQPSHQKAGEH
jgi:hypothetical protein